MSSPRRNRNNIQLTASAGPHGGRTLCEQLRVTGEDLCVALLPTHVRMSVNTESTNINTGPQLTASLDVLPSLRLGLLCVSVAPPSSHTRH